VLPNAGAFHHVAFLNFWLRRSGVFFSLSLVPSSSRELGLEILLDLLLARLLFFLECSKVALASIFLVALGLLALLLLLSQS